MESSIDAISLNLDRLYMICENQNDERRCEQIQSLLDRKHKEFSKLLLQIKERKVHAQQSGLIIPMPLEMGSHMLMSSGLPISPRSSTFMDPIHQNAALARTKLRADAPVFQPGGLMYFPVTSTNVPPPPGFPSMTASPQIAPKVSPASNEQQQKAATASNYGQQKSAAQVLESQTKMLNFLGDNSKTGTFSNQQKTKVNVKSFPNTSLISPFSMPASNRTTKIVKKESSRLASVANAPEPAKKEELEEMIHQEMVKATEQVWAAAEAWIEAEAEAEEEEWRILEWGINRYVGLTDTPLDDGDDVFELDDDMVDFTSSAFNSPHYLSIETSIGALEDISVSTSLQEAKSKQSMAIAALRSTTPIKLIDISVKRSDVGPTSVGQRFSTPPSTLAGRTLHEKLSSPDRKRSISPSEALKRYEARQIAAELNRDKTVAEKVQKAMIASNRVKNRMMKEAEKQAQAKQALKEKLANAAERHKEYLNTIRGKAGTENAKVTEVLTSNSLNSDAVANDLQAKLEEVEARILAANIRREQRLADISGSQRKKNTKKTEQMSEYRLQLARQKMERWEKLQKRLESVQERRRARLAQLKSLEAEAGKRTGSASGSNVTDVMASGASSINGEIGVIRRRSDQSLFINESATIDDISISIITTGDNTPVKIEIHSPTKIAEEGSGQKLGSSSSASSHGGGSGLSTGVLATPSGKVTIVETPTLIESSSSRKEKKNNEEPTIPISETSSYYPVPYEAVEEAHSKLTDMLSKPKITSVRNDAWNAALSCLENSNSFYSLYCNGNQPTSPTMASASSSLKVAGSKTLSPLKYIVQQMMASEDTKKKNYEERGASSYNLYASLIKEIDTAGLVASSQLPLTHVGSSSVDMEEKRHDLIEKINFLVQNTVDCANSYSGNADHSGLNNDAMSISSLNTTSMNGIARLQDFIQSGGVLLLSVLLSVEYGLLSSALVAKSFLSDSSSSSSSSPSSTVDFHLVLELIKLIIIHVTNGSGEEETGADGAGGGGDESLMGNEGDDDQPHDDKMTIIASHNCIHVLAGCGIHIVLTELNLFLLLLQQSYRKMMSSFTTSSSEEDWKIVGVINTMITELTATLSMSSQVIMKIFNKLDDNNAITSGFCQENQVLTNQNNVNQQQFNEIFHTKLLQNIHVFQQYAFLCNHLPLLFGNVQLEVLDWQRRFDNDRSKQYQLSLQSEEDQLIRSHCCTQSLDLFTQVALYARAVTLYVSKHSRIESSKCAKNTGTSAKHWWSLMRRNNVLQVVVDSFELAVRYMLRNLMDLSLKESHLLLQLVTESLDTIFIMVTIDSEIFKRISSERKASFIDAMHYFLLLSNAHLLENGFHGDNNSMQECIHRLFSVVCTLCQSDYEVRKFVAESSLNAVTANTASSSKVNPILFNNLIEQMKNMHTATPEQLNHYQHVLSNSKSFLQTMCALPIRLYKDKRLKNSLIPCLMAATFEIDSSRSIVKLFGKDRYIKKYLDYYIKERDSLHTSGLVEDLHLETNAENVDEDRQRKVARLRRFSQLIPSKLWDLLAVMWLQD